MTYSWFITIVSSKGRKPTISIAKNHPDLAIAVVHVLGGTLVHLGQYTNYIQQYICIYI